MDTRKLGYLGIGILLTIVAVTLLGVPPAVWLSVGLIAAMAVTIIVIERARAQGIDIAQQVVALASAQTGAPRAGADDRSTSPDGDPAVEVELVRPADEAAGTPAVWLHRRGGRRVHRFATADGWSVQQVSTKAPDNPRKRVIGETLTVASEYDAIRAADRLAQGVTASTTRPQPRHDQPVLAAAEA
jgi:hypothetical protein